MTTAAGPNNINLGLSFSLDAGNARSYPGSGDSFFSNVSMLLLGETTSDSSQNAVTMTATGTAAASSTQYKYGTKSLYFESGSNYLSTPDNVIFQLGSGDWTIECWVYVTSNTGTNGIICKRNPGTYDGYCLGTDSSNQFYITITNTAGSWTLGGSILGTGVTPNTWHHLAAVRSGNTITGYVNGVAGTPYSFTGSVYETGGKSVFIGNSDGGASGQNFKGYIDNFRLTKGVARYTANFVPPIKQFNRSNNLTWSDLQLNNFDLNLINGPTYSALNGGHIVFDGTNDYGDVTITSTTVFCAEIWVFFNGQIGQDADMTLITGYQCASFSYQLGGSYSGSYDGFTLGNWTGSATNETIGYFHNSTFRYIIDPISAGWHQIGINWNSSSGSYDIYVDGTVRTTYSGSYYPNIPQFSTTRVTLGSGTVGSIGQYFFNGKIAAAKLWNLSLTAAEILQNYNSLRPRYVAPQ